MCLYPTIIKNRKYTSNKKNKGIVPIAQDERVLYVPVGCGKCMECKKKKKREWQVRLSEEIRENKKAYFVTMTMNNESIRELSTGIRVEGYERDNQIMKKGMRRFLERWRKKYKKSVRHWAITEVGGGRYEHTHIHGIIWTDEDKEEIEKIWKYGYVFIGNEVNERTVNYIIKYVNKVDEKHPNYNQIILTSSGIGKNYIKRRDSERNKYKEKKTIETYMNEKGFKIGIPIYYRNKIYTEEEKEKLWIEKLDKKIRYVNGIEIDISKNENKYYEVLKEEQKRNTRLGYGKNEIDWDKRMYENQRRNLIHKERVSKAEEKKGTQFNKS